MERTAPSKKDMNANFLAQVSQRLSMAYGLGQQSYGGARDIYQALGYLPTITYLQYYERYKRQDIAKAVIDRPATTTWSGKLIVAEEDAVKGEFEKAWSALNLELKLKSKLIRLDKLSGIGAYGCLMLGFDDVSGPEGFKKAVTKGNRKLLYIKPYGQGSAKIIETDKNTKSPRYGLPLIYELGTEASSQDETTIDAVTPVKVHYTRVLHVAGELLESEVYGASKLQVIFNRLMDLEKLVGGDAEMFWRGARPGYAGTVDPEFMMTPDTKADLQEQIDEYEHNLRRILVNEGVDLKELAQQIADPKNHVDVQISMISAVTGIPKRILIGSERGELSSGQDRSEWLSFVETRRTEFAEPMIVRPFIDRLIEYGVLPKPKNDVYVIRWEDLFSLTEKDKVEIGRSRATALKEYSANPVASSMMPFKAFVKYFLGLDEEDVMSIIKLQEEDMKEEDAEWKEYREKMIPEKNPGPEAGQRAAAPSPASGQTRTRGNV